MICYGFANHPNIQIDLTARSIDLQWDCNENKFVFIDHQHLVIFDFQTRQNKQIPNTHKQNQQICLHNDKIILASADKIKIWEDEQDQPTRIISRIKKDRSPLKVDLTLFEMALCDNKIAIANYDHAFVELYDLNTGECIHHFELDAFPRGLDLQKHEEGFSLHVGLHTGQIAGFIPPFKPGAEPEPFVLEKTCWQYFRDLLFALFETIFCCCLACEDPE
jgi:WD40 repeat protein